MGAPRTVAALVVALVLVGPVGPTSAGTAGQSTGAETAVSMTPGGTISAERWETVTVTVRANATNVSGYQSAVTYDPTVLQVRRVSGTADFDSPVATVDNRNGSVVFNQIRSGETTDPALVKLAVEVIGTGGQRGALSVVADETKFSDATGATVEPTSTSGVTVAVQSTGSDPNETDTSGQSGPGFGGPAVLLATVIGVAWLAVRYRHGT